MTQVHDVGHEARPATPVLSEQQLNFFEIFGFLKLPGFFLDEVGEITEAFEEVFAAKALLQALHLETDDPPWLETNFDLHFNKPRVTIPLITERHERLAQLQVDPRVTTIVSQVMGPERRWESTGADASLFYCDTSWHVDSYGAPLKQYHVKLSMYLDELGGENGAIRVMPGTNFPLGPFARRLLPLLDDPAVLEETLGVPAADLPAYTITSTPGDLVLWNYRLVHGSFYGADRRRLLSLNFREVLEPEPAQS